MLRSTLRSLVRPARQRNASPAISRAQECRALYLHLDSISCVGGNCLTLTKSEIDKAHKDSKKKFKEDFELSFFFNRPAGDMSPSSPFVQGGAALQAQAVPAASATSLPGQPVMTWEPDSLPNVADMSSDEEDEDNMPADGGYGFSSSAFVTDDGFEEDDDDDDIDGGAETLI